MLYAKASFDNQFERKFCGVYGCFVLCLYVCVMCGACYHLNFHSRGGALVPFSVTCTCTSLFLHLHRIYCDLFPELVEAHLQAKKV